MQPSEEDTLRRQGMEVKEKIKERVISLALLLTPFAVSVTHESVKTGRPPEPQTRLSHSYPAAF